MLIERMNETFNTDRQTEELSRDGEMNLDDTAVQTEDLMSSTRSLRLRTLLLGDGDSPHYRAHYLDY